MVHGSAGSTAEGTRLHYWSPKTVGRDFETTPILRSLEPYRDYVTVVSHSDIAPATAHLMAPDQWESLSSHLVIEADTVHFNCGHILSYSFELACIMIYLKVD